MRTAPLLDTRFLSVHPTTARWWAQREKCRACAHYLPPTELMPHVGEKCGASPWPGAGWPQKQFEMCIDARATAEDRGDGRDGLCGPDAVMWEPAK